MHKVSNNAFISTYYKASLINSPGGSYSPPKKKQLNRPPISGTSLFSPISHPIPALTLTSTDLLLRHTSLHLVLKDREREDPHVRFLLFHPHSPSSYTLFIFLLHPCAPLLNSL
ncbi:hypothetical protein CEXT_751591 [Caerostris extrusa]|uniref:Uncharacterized protein n=1 Tax=Caerostris extrusa TaxID=172846 RepID=A0AAV4NQU8_CAEEX|nr:hypothetical protein CEXT_751591 [Caerostris extrusa]